VAPPPLAVAARSENAMHSSRTAPGSGLRSLRLLLAVTAGLIGLLAASIAGATDGPGGTDTLRWVNPNGGAWTDAANWSPANVPDNDNEVAIMDSLVPTPYTVTLGTGLLAGGMRVSKYAILDVNTIGRFQLDGVPFNFGTIRLSGGVDWYINRPLFQNLGTLIIGQGGAEVELRMPTGNAGTIDQLSYHGNPTGRIQLDGGALYLFCSGLLDGTIERLSGDEEVTIEYAVPQRVTIAPNTVVRVTGLMDLLESGGALINNGTVIVSGTFQGPMGGVSNSLTGTGEMVLDQGRIVSGNNNTGVLINQAGHTIRGCGTIEATIVNYGTIESDCPYSVLNVKSHVENYGTIKGLSGILWIYGSPAQITNSGNISAVGGTVWIDQGASIWNYQGVIRADGRSIELSRNSTATILGGTIDAAGAGTVYVQGTATLRDVTLAPAATLRTWPGATTIATGTAFTNRGTSRVQGTFTVGNTTNYIQSGGATSLEGGSLNAGRPVQIQGGELRGYGTIAANVASFGTVSPDPLLGALTIQGDYFQYPSGLLNVGFAGSGPGQNSLLQVTGNAALDGTVSAAAVNGYAPVPGRQYEVLSYGSLSGAFGTVRGDLAGQLDVTALYDADGMGLLVTGVTGVDPRLQPRALRFYGRGGVEAAFVIELPRDATVSVRAYDARGREVARLADGFKPAGLYRFALSGPGAPSLASGVYFARVTVESAGTTETRTARVVALR
jgi:hypothetical protein